MSYTSTFRSPAHQYNALNRANKTDLMLFFGNVDYLANKRYGSRNKAIIALKERIGWHQRSLSVTHYKRGTFVRCNLTTLNAWSLLFNEPLWRLLSVSYQEEDEIAAAKGDNP